MRMPAPRPALQRRADLARQVSSSAGLRYPQLAEAPKASRGAIKGALKGKLRNDKDNAYLSRKLAEILVDIPLPQEPSLPLSTVNAEGLSSCLEDLELNSLLRQVGGFVAAFSEGGYGSNAEAAAPAQPSSMPKVTKNDPGLEETVGSVPALRPQLIQDTSALQGLVQRLMTCTDTASPVALDTETTDLNPFKAELVGIGVCWGEELDALAYIPLGHKGSADSQPVQLPLETVVTALAPWLGSEDHPKALQNAKFDRLILMRHGLALGGVLIDTLLADYLRDAAAKHGLELMAEREFGFQPTAYSDLVGKKQTFADVPLEAASQYCAMDVHVTRRLALLLRNQLEAMGPALLKLLEQVEQPLEPVLAEMEATGIRIDVPYLQELSTEMGTTLERLERDAKEAAGVDFNLASPKQLGELLFDTLGLDRKKSRRTKTGYSTDATVLEKLGDDHPVVPLVLEHRVLSKLKSTYIDALPQLVEAETGRVHTDFNQAVTATGRLSSSNPNLQNIPVRTEYSRRIRKAFLPQDGWTLLSADYSQIELRILTHLSGEEVLQEAYRSGDDVHALTARLLLDKDEVSADERRLGKTINFGVIYGMGAQRFARETGVSQTEAKDFLAKYKQRYPKGFAFLELQERLALSRGYVETILGRRRPFHFDRNGLGRLLGKDPLEIDLDVARRGGMDAQLLPAAANGPILNAVKDPNHITDLAIGGERVVNKRVPASPPAPTSNQASASAHVIPIRSQFPMQDSRLHERRTSNVGGPRTGAERPGRAPRRRQEAAREIGHVPRPRGLILDHGHQRHDGALRAPGPRPRPGAACRARSPRCAPRARPAARPVDGGDANRLCQ